MKSNVFLVHTEYHLYLAINIIYSKYQDYINHIYVTRGRINKTFSLETKAIVFHYLPAKNYGTDGVFIDMYSSEPERFFFYQENSDGIYLAYRFQKKNVIVSLVQDGLKPYPYPIRKRKFLLIHIVLDTLTFYKEMISRKAVIPRFFLVLNHYYGYSRYIDELWLQFPNKFHNKYHKHLIKIPDVSPKAVGVLNDLFEYNGENYDRNAILFIAEYVIRYDDCMKTEKEILSYLVNKYPNRTIYYKIHPGTLQRCIDEIITDFPSLIIVNDGVPAELHILNLKDTMIISMFSTANLTNNPTCRSYWTHDLYSKSNRLLSQMVFSGCPADHVKEVNSIEEIV